MRIASVSSELAPLAKTGGLGDVAAALPLHLHRAGHDVRPFLPMYGSLDPGGRPVEPVGFARDMDIRMGRRTFRCALYATPLAPGGPVVYLVDCPPLYSGRGIYAADGDEHLRFGVLARASIEACQRMAFSPDAFHAHDWHAGLVPLYLKTHYAWDALFRRTGTVFTIHNLGYQGTFPASVVDDLDLGGHVEHLDRADLAEGRFGFMRTAIHHAGAVTAVSRTYAREILTREQGMGLDGLLRARSGSVLGIVNGIDADEWNPATDPHLPARFSADDLSGKAVCRERLLAETGLAPAPSGPVLGVVSRFTAQKGLDLLFETLPPVLASADARLVALGGGEPRYEEFFRSLERRFPGRAAYRDGHRNPLAHRIEAGADAFLMPSRFEPCGLNQMYSQRYGTLPVVRRTGGLADTVEQWNPDTGAGTGFVFEHFTETGMAWALDVMLRAWRDRAAWARLVRNAMALDNSWDRRVADYLRVFAAVGET